jgi:hypothetical protein
MVSSISLPLNKPVQVRRSFLIKYKWHAINAINDLMLSGYTLCTPTKELNIPHWYYKMWRKTVVKVDKLASSDAVVPFKIHGDCRKIHPFHPSELDPFLGNLTCSIFEMREQGLPHTLRKEAARLSQVFKNKSTKAKISSVNCFVKNGASLTLFRRMSHRRITRIQRKSRLIS